MRALIVALLVLAGTAASAPAARPAPGTYTGTVAGSSIGFKVAAGKVRALRLGRVVARCDDGSAVGVRLRPLGAGWSVRVRNGRFHKTAVIGNATRLGPLAVSGRFRRKLERPAHR